MTFGRPLIDPVNNDGRYFYETGRDGSFQIPVTLADPIPAAFEGQSFICKQPCWLAFLHAQVPIQANNVFVLLYDVFPDANTAQDIITRQIPARYSFGPILAAPASGGTLIYEAVAEEVPCRVDAARRHPSGYVPTVKGLPFNFGILAIASSTVRVPTVTDGQGEPLDLQMAIIARMQA